MSLWRRSGRVVSVRPSGTPTRRGRPASLPGPERDPTAPRASDPVSPRIGIAIIGWAASFIAVVGLVGLLVFLVAGVREEQQGISSVGARETPPAVVATAAVKSATPRPTASATKGPAHGTGRSYVNEEFRFAVDGYHEPHPLGPAQVGAWDFGIYFWYSYQDIAFTVVVLATRDRTLKNDRATARRWYDAVPVDYPREGATVSARKLGTLDESACMIVRSRLGNAATGDRLVVLDYWIPGKGFGYLVRGFAGPGEWGTVSPRIEDVVRTFECW